MSQDFIPSLIGPQIWDQHEPPPIWNPEQTCRSHCVEKLPHIGANVLVGNIAAVVLLRK
jgi:hypothetical protein